MHRVSSLLLAGLLAAAVINCRLSAADRCCRQCGAAPVSRTCRLECKDKTVTITRWGCQRDEFCIPGPSRPGCQHEEFVGTQSSASDPVCSAPKRFCWTEWIPGHARIHTRSRLMRQTVTRKIPSYQWVVEDLCAACAADAEAAVAELPPGTELPPRPVPGRE